MLNIYAASAVRVPFLSLFNDVLLTSVEWIILNL